MLHSSPGEDPVLLEALLPAPVDRVFRAWTDSEDILHWFGSPEDRAQKAEMDLRVGGIWSIRFGEDAKNPGWLEGEYVEIVPHERLVFTWTHRIQDESGHITSTAPSRVTLTLLDEGGKTRLHLRHEAIEREAARQNVGAGWVATLERLEKRLAA